MKKHVIGHISATHGLRGGVFAICGYSFEVNNYEEFIEFINRGILEADCKICIRVYNDVQQRKKCCTNPVCWKYGSKVVRKIK